MRLIDADELKGRIQEWADRCNSSLIKSLCFIKAKDIVVNAPTVDAEPVVRCKKCRYWERFGNTSLGTCYHGIYAGSNLGTPENHFCASAARKDGGEGE